MFNNVKDADLDDFKKKIEERNNIHIDTISQRYNFCFKTGKPNRTRNGYVYKKINKGLNVATRPKARRLRLRKKLD
jgi:hypothetical protein